MESQDIIAALRDELAQLRAETRQRIRTLKAEIAMQDAALDYVAVLVGLDTDVTWTQIFSRIRELVAKEAKS